MTFITLINCLYSKHQVKTSLQPQFVGWQSCVWPVWTPEWGESLISTLAEKRGLFFPSSLTQTNICFLIRAPESSWADFNVTIQRRGSQSKKITPTWKLINSLLVTPTGCQAWSRHVRFHSTGNHTPATVSERFTHLSVWMLTPPHTQSCLIPITTTGGILDTQHTFSCLSCGRVQHHVLQLLLETSDERASPCGE